MLQKVVDIFELCHPGHLLYYLKTVLDLQGSLTWNYFIRQVMHLQGFCNSNFELIFLDNYVFNGL